jgi:hypothetical protein
VTNVPHDERLGDERLSDKRLVTNVLVTKVLAPKFHHKLLANLDVTKNSLKKAPF